MDSEDSIQDPFLYDAHVFICVFISLAFNEPRWDMLLGGVPASPQWSVSSQLIAGQRQTSLG